VSSVGNKTASKPSLGQIKEEHQESPNFNMKQTSPISFGSAPKLPNNSKANILKNNQAE